MNNVTYRPVLNKHIEKLGAIPALVVKVLENSTNQCFHIPTPRAKGVFNPFYLDSRF
jgi:hypothetical protein